MRSILLALLTIGAGGLGAGHAQSAAQLYPYCSLSTSSGATSCYFSSRAQCGGSCIENPAYVGPQRTAPYRGARRAPARHYVRP